MKISIIHPSRNRPEQAYKTWHKWVSSAADKNNIEYILSIDDDEPLLQAYLKAFNGSEVTISVHPNNTAIEAINNAAKQSTGNLLIAVSDDFACPYHWDVALLQALEGKSDYIVKTEDGIQPWIMTLPIMDRKYYERFGYVYNPAYKHMFCDCELAHVAEILGKTITLPIKFPHNHYTTGKVKADNVNAKNDATWAQGEKLYLERLMRSFDLPKEQIVNPIDQIPLHHRDWLRSKGIIFEYA